MTTQQLMDERVTTASKYLSNDNNRVVTSLRWWRDTSFWCLFFAAPVCWLILFQVAGMPINQALPEAWRVPLMVILVYPVLEEIVFRGALQGFLQDKLEARGHRHSFYGLTLANVITSVLFTSLHFINQAPVWAALVFIPSLVFGWVRDRYNHLVTPVLLHIWYNAGFFLLFSN